MQIFKTYIRTDKIKLPSQDITNCHVQVRDEATDLETEYVIIGCLVRAVAHLRGVYMYGTMMEW
jgi:hypothetical protein